MPAIAAAIDADRALPAGGRGDGAGLAWPGRGGLGQPLYLLAAGDDDAAGLRLEKKFDILAPKPAGPGGTPGGAAPRKEARPVFITADRLAGRSEEINIAEGNVELRKYGYLLLADKLVYRPLEDEVDASGNVLLQQNADEIRGPHLRMRLTDQIGFFEEAQYKFDKRVPNRFYRPVSAVTTTVSVNTATGSAPLMINVPAGYGLPTTVSGRRTVENYGYAERIDFEGENRVRLTTSTYSTCKPGDKDWYLKADEMKLDYDHGEGEARDATVVFKDVPIFYAPFASFPLNHERKSGFLMPDFAYSSRNGLDLTFPYYWKLAPNYDATFYPRELGKRGVQLGAEAQYVDYNYRGSTRLEYLPNDKLEDRSRYAYGINHTHNLGRGLTASLNWNGVSDDRYWQDLSSRLLQTSQTQLPRQALLNYASGSWWTANIQTLRYQTLSPDPANPVTRPYFIEPQLNFSGRLNDFYKRTDLSIFGQYTNFTHPNQVEGGRTVLYPQLTLPYISPAMTVLPKVGLHMTQYSLQHAAAGDPTSIGRTLPTFSFDSTVFFERESKWLDAGYIQTLEPRLYYVYIPYRNQEKIPVFDSAIADFNFAQIFNENRYTGFDRINDANQLTAAVTTRFLDANTGAERFKAMVGQRYYFRQQRVTIPGETARADDLSNFLAAVNGAILPKTYVDAALEYNYHLNQTGRFSVGARYQPDLAKVLSASYRFTRDGLGTTQVEQIDIAGQWPIAKHWYAVGRYNFSVRDRQALETIGGVEYNAGCWAARAVVQRLTALAGAPNTTFFLQLELNDFASIGSNPIQLLRRTIPGYGKVNEMPTTGSLLTTQ